MKEPDYIDRYLEIDKLIDEGVKLRNVGDNLRSYPVIVAFGIAIFYLWQQPTVAFIPAWVFRGVAVLWGAWVGWFGLLTAAQSGFLLVAMSAELLKPRYEKRPRLKSFAIIVVAVMAVIFMFGALFVVIALSGAVRR